MLRNLLQIPRNNSTERNEEGRQAYKFTKYFE